ncbi:MAG TPA: hypothetical protein VH206_17485 [Xanthobacteraceae bacterium]|jgi:hypothetical protein|nr:hypothetical protein [Xanthobacteraceae bacterium]
MNSLVSVASLASSTAISAPALADERAPDPIFAAIDKHHAADDKFGEAIGLVSQFEEEHRDAAGHFSCSEDDPEYVRLEELRDEAGDASGDATRKMFLTAPTTLVGLAALVDVVEKNEEFLQIYMNKEDRTLCTGAFIRSVSTAIKTISSGSSTAADLSISPAMASTQTDSDAKLFRLGARLELVRKQWSAQRSADKRKIDEWDARCVAACLPRAGGDDMSEEDWLSYREKREALFVGDKDDVDTDGTSKVWTKIHGKMMPLVDKILAIKATSLSGLAIQATAMSMSSAEWWEDLEEESSKLERQLVESICSAAGIVPAPLVEA